MHVGRNVLALNLICLALHQNGEHVTPREHGVDLDLATIQATLPAPARPAQLQAVTLSIDCDVVDHENLLPVTSGYCSGGLPVGQLPAWPLFTGAAGRRIT